jgi:hypothetical protein
MFKRNRYTRDDILIRASGTISENANYMEPDVYQKLYVDAGYFSDKKSTILYGNYEAGKVYKIDNKLSVIPYVTTGVLYSNDNSEKQSVTKLDVGAGVGVAMSTSFYDTKYETYQFNNKLKVEARQKYAGNANDDSTIQMLWELSY